MPKSAELARQIEQQEWFHTIDLGDGLVTKGASPHNDMLLGAIPDLRGKSVLDIGAWDGKWSFAAEAAGATRVVALDHYVWRLDFTARQSYYEESAAEGVLPDPDMIDRGFLVDGLPGKQGFDLVHHYLDSKVEAVVDDLMTMDLDNLGQFDVVFYFGVLYHMANPIEAMKRLRQVTGTVAVIETAGIEVPAFADKSLIEFYPGAERQGDYGNWFAPSEVALVGLCRSAGFRHVEIVAKTSPALTAPEPPSPAGRTVRLRRQRPEPPPLEPAPLARIRLVAHAFT